MSQVRVNQRHDSKAQFIDTARELVIHTIKYARKFPKSAMFLITKDLVDTSRDIYKSVVLANTVFPKTKLDVEIRYKHLKSALGYIDILDCFLGIAKEEFKTTDISEYGWVHWGELLLKESNLIKKVLASDSNISF